MSQERAIRLHAGPWSLEFERWSGWVRCIRMNGMEVVRAIYANVRDENWVTQQQHVVHTDISQEEGRFEAHWKIELDEMAYTWTGSMVCDGVSIEVEWQGESGQEFQTRRTGMCVLHPEELRGMGCEVEHTDGTVETGALPYYVEPHQPFFDIRAFRYTAYDQVKLEFRGEVFEMEDQRNWSDASFKTYCRPQAWPQPYTVEAGEKLHHGLRITSDEPATGWEPESIVTFDPNGVAREMPLLGTVSSKPVDGFDFVLAPGDDEAWSSIGLGKIDYRPGGFVDLNRNRPVGDWDGVAYTVSPQVHAFDERSIMENAGALWWQTRTAKLLIAKQVACVGPIEFRRARQGRDPRLDSEIAPAWFLASLFALSQGRAKAACFLEASDFRGRLREALELVAGQRYAHLYTPSVPNRALAFHCGNSNILVNLRPYSTFVHLHEDVELGPYEIRRMG